MVTEAVTVVKEVKKRSTNGFSPVVVQDDQQEREIDLVDYLNVFLKHFRCLLVGVCASLFGFAGYYFSQPEVFSAEAVVSFEVETQRVASEDTTVVTLKKASVELLTSISFGLEVINKHFQVGGKEVSLRDIFPGRLSDTWVQFATRIVRVTPGNSLVYITVNLYPSKRLTSVETAQLVADVANSFSELLEQKGVKVMVLDKAIPPSSSVRSFSAQRFWTCLFCGLLIGLFSAAMAEFIEKNKAQGRFGETQKLWYNLRHPFKKKGGQTMKD